MIYLRRACACLQAAQRYLAGPRAATMSRPNRRASTGVFESNDGPEANGVLLDQLTMHKRRMTF
jgi:hypothetical protein